MAAPQAQVLYEYEAQDGDQLTIKPGDIIEIIDDSLDLNGWALARKGNKEGYVPADYVRYIETNKEPTYGDEWRTVGFEQYYTTILAQEHNLPYCEKLSHFVKEVYVPYRCSKFMYTMKRSDLKRGAILNLLFSFLVAIVDSLTMIAPCLPFDSNSSDKPEIVQVILTIVNIILRVMLCLWFIGRYPRGNLTIMTFPFLSVISSLTYSIRVYELLEMGDNKEYDGYRYYRSWMWSSLLNVPFAIAGLVLVLKGYPGLDAVSIVILVLNLLNVGRCFLAAWACVESGNDIHSDFQKTIKSYHL